MPCLGHLCYRTGGPRPDCCVTLGTLGLTSPVGGVRRWDKEASRGPRTSPASLQGSPLPVEPFAGKLPLIHGATVCQLGAYQSGILCQDVTCVRVRDVLLFPRSVLQVPWGSSFSLPFPSPPDLHPEGMRVLGDGGQAGGFLRLCLLSFRGIGGTTVRGLQSPALTARGQSWLAEVLGQVTQPLSVPQFPYL